MNLTDLSFLLTLVAGTLGGFGTAHVHATGTASTILSTAGGLALGAALGLASNRIGYAILDSKAHALA
jgi:hypothetical protein